MKPPRGKVTLHLEVVVQVEDIVKSWTVAEGELLLAGSAEAREELFGQALSVPVKRWDIEVLDESLDLKPSTFSGSLSSETRSTNQDAASATMAPGPTAGTAEMPGGGSGVPADLEKTSIVAPVARQTQHQAPSSVHESASERGAADA